MRKKKQRRNGVGHWNRNDWLDCKKSNRNEATRLLSGRRRGLNGRKLVRNKLKRSNVSYFMDFLFCENTCELGESTKS